MKKQQLFLVIASFTFNSALYGSFFKERWERLANPKQQTPLMHAILNESSDEEFNRAVEQARQSGTLNRTDRDGNTAFYYLCESTIPFLKQIELASVLRAAGLKTSGWIMSNVERVLMYNVDRQHSRLPNVSQFIQTNAFLFYAMNDSWIHSFKNVSTVSVQQYQKFMLMLLQNYQKGNVITEGDFFSQEVKKYVDVKKRTAPHKLPELTKSFDARVKELVGMGLDIDFDKDNLFSNERFALSCAIKNNDYDAVDVLLKHGADCCSIITGHTVLLDAAVYANGEIMNALLAVIKQKNKLGLVNYTRFGQSTALAEAVKKDNQKSVILLLKAGALVDDQSGLSVLDRGPSALSMCKDESLRSILVGYEKLQAALHDSNVLSAESFS